ncbi:MAG: phosphomannose isomerase type II C-terminal cupin domain [Candidatus Calescibacterium sp.]|nr:phosphomannose isomerase type II C-terminal cupin domain [Candidatus Calescibacterium sp.]MCX7734764.1 phosphomannose isomerase type II C-terminal cupin domain [bacterium]MDW8087354.1 phosphomannose isomerase type II C-terminal cupin domain [Candidatus Calescibacterium sp.]
MSLEAELGKIVSDLILNHKTELDKDIRPWGGYITLWEDKNFKVKILFVLPKKRLSLQRHKHRKEKWFIVEGEAIITKGKAKFSMKEGNSLIIEKEELHRIENKSQDKILKIVEIWMGDILDEKDIERFEDDFGRV